MIDQTLTQEQAHDIKQKLTRLNLWKKKEAVVTDFSMNSSTHIGELTPDEAEGMLKYLAELEEKANKMRRKLLSIGYDMFFDEPNSPAQQAMNRKDRNFKNVSAWCESKRCKIQKPLKSLDPFELVEVVTQFEQVLRSFNEDRKKKNAQKN